MKIAIAVTLGFVLDLIFGDPSFIPHPIVLIGKLISVTEKGMRKIFPDTAGGKRAAGVFTNLIVLTVSFGVPFIILYWLYRLNLYAGLALETFWCFQILAGKSLRQAAYRVYKCIVAGNLEDSRKYLSWIVGRDTQDLDFKAITKAVVETVAENCADGVVAPLFFMVIGGAPLGFLYKAVNTLDSMVGYKNDVYIDFGRFSAKVDDVFNFIPARITGINMILAAFILRYDGKGAARIFRRDRHNHASPNSAQTESACAGALDIQLAGDAYYFGKLYKKKTIGDDIKEIDAQDIKKSVRLMYGASIISFIIFILVRVITVIYI